jgi:hypothetical protein
MKICCPQCGGKGEECEWCGGSGLCCPNCNGAGWLAKRRKGNSSLLVRCGVCQLEMSDGAQFDAERAMQAIRRYIDDWFTGNVEDPVITRRMDDERALKEREKASRPGGLWKHG